MAFSSLNQNSECLLSKYSLEWIDETLNALSNCSIRANYFAFEGLPCGGKTTTIRRLRQLYAHAICNEIRLPPHQETCLAYLSLEPMRNSWLSDKKTSSNVILGDRSVVSTITHKAALLTYESRQNFSEELTMLANCVQNGTISLPSDIIWMNVSIEQSRYRQAIRDRDILAGRLWYDKQFLELFSCATTYISLHLIDKSKVLIHNIDSDTQDLEDAILDAKMTIQSRIDAMGDDCGHRL